MCLPISLPRPLIPFALLHHHPCSSLSFLLLNGGPLRIIIAADPTPIIHLLVSAFRAPATGLLRNSSLSLNLNYIRRISLSILLLARKVPVLHTFLGRSTDPTSVIRLELLKLSSRRRVLQKSLLPLHHLQIHSLQVTALCNSGLCLTRSLDYPESSRISHSLPVLLSGASRTNIILVPSSPLDRLAELDCLTTSLRLRDFEQSSPNHSTAINSPLYHPITISPDRWLPATGIGVSVEAISLHSTCVHPLISISA